MQQHSLYVARIDLGRACGSWHVDSDPDEAIIGVVNRAYRDWRSMFELDGRPVTVQLFKLQANGSEEWDGRSERRFPDHRILAPHSLEAFSTELRYVNQVLDNAAHAPKPIMRSGIDEVRSTLRKLRKRLEYAESKGVPEGLRDKVVALWDAIYSADDSADDLDPFEA